MFDRGSRGRNHQIPQIITIAKFFKTYTHLLTDENASKGAGKEVKLGFWLNLSRLEHSDGCVNS